jgi:hypothetical protein
MSQFPESAFQEGREGAGFLSLLAIALAVVTAMVGVAILIAAG